MNRERRGFARRPRIPPGAFAGDEHLHLPSAPQPRGPWKALENGDLAGTAPYRADGAHRVLMIAEGDDRAAAALADILWQQGFEVEVAAAPVVVDRLRKSRYVAAVVDAASVAGGTAQVLAQIRSADPSLAVLVVGDQQGSPDAGEGENAGMSVPPDEVAAVLGAVVSRSHVSDRQRSARERPAEANGAKRRLRREIESRRRAVREAQLAKGSAARGLAQLQAVVAGISEGIVIADPAGRIVVMNSAAQRMCGYAHAEQVRASVTDLAHRFELRTLDGEAIDVQQWPFARARRGERFANVEHELRRRDNGRTWIGSFGGAPIYNETGELLFALVTIRDITTEKRTEVAVRESEERFRIMAETVPDIIFSVGPDMQCHYVNRRFTDLTGLPSHAAYGFGWTRVLHPEDLDQVRTVTQRASEIGEPFQAELRLRRADEGYRWCAAKARPIRDADGRIVQWFGTCTDIEQHKCAESNLLSMNETLEDRVAERTALIKLLHEVASAANSAESFTEILDFVLERVSRHNGWCFGHGYVVSDDDVTLLAPVATSYQDSPGRFEQLHEAMLAAPLRRGEGLPGRVFATGEPEWAADASAELQSRGANAAEAEGLMAVAYPVVVGERVRAVLEFFAEPSVEELPRLAESMASICTQLGRVIERERAAAALRSSEQRLRAVFKNAAIGIAIAEAGGHQRLLRTNGTLNHMLGREAGELVGKPLSTFAHPDDARADEELFRDLCSGRLRSYQSEQRFLRRDGEIVWCTASVSLIRDDNGKPLRTITLLADNTECRRAEAELRQINLSLEHATEGIARIDHQGRYLAVNRTFVDLLKSSPWELVGSPWLDIIHPADRKRAWQALERMASGDSAESDARALRRDGSIVHLHIVLWRAAAGHHYVFVKDITESKERAQQIAEAVLREQRRIGRELHDNLGQQLTGAAMLTGTLYQRLRSADSPEAGAVLELVQQLTAAHAQVRALARGLTPIEVDASELPAALRALAQDITRRSGIPCEVSCSARICLSDNATATQLYLIAQEAVSNAVRHAGAGRIAISLRRDPHHVTLRIQDDGCGLPEPRPRSGGVGLGIMQYRARAIGTSLDIEASQGEGTSVICRLETEGMRGHASDSTGK